jgi:hypothetical protein
MVPAFILIALMAAVATPAESYSVPKEMLVPALAGTIYIGDDLTCSAEYQGVWRYDSERALSLCSGGVWHAVTIGPENR